jgi:hypothetical protein
LSLIVYNIGGFAPPTSSDTNMNGRNRSSAQSLIETVVGIIFMIPIVLFLFDIGVMVLANTANDNLAKQAARAAAGATPPGNPTPTLGNVAQFRNAAKQAADQVVSNYTSASHSAYMTNVTMAKMWYDNQAVAGTNAPPGAIDLNPGPGNVAVFTHMDCNPPVPFPGFNTTRTFFARAIEPIVALPPS